MNSYDHIVKFVEDGSHYTIFLVKDGSHHYVMPTYSPAEGWVLTTPSHPVVAHSIDSTNGKWASGEFSTCVRYL